MGRNRQYDNNAERQRAYRERQAQQRLPPRVVNANARVRQLMAQLAQRDERIAELEEQVNDEPSYDLHDDSVEKIAAAIVRELANLKGGRAKAKEIAQEILGLRDEVTAVMVSTDVLTEELAPLFKRVKEQSKRHVGLISKGDLLMIAANGQSLLDSWANGERRVITRASRSKRGGR